MSELLPCPFCGSTPYMQTLLQNDSFVYYIICTHCDSAGLRSFEKEKAIERWNTRHYPPEVEKAVEKMKPVSIKPEKTDEYHQCGDEFYLVRCPDCGKEFKLLGFKYSTDVRYCGCCGKAFTLDWSEE